MPSGGTILLNGEDITDLSVHERIEKGIAYVPEDRQEVGLLLDCTLTSNLVLKKLRKTSYCRRGVLQKKAIAAAGKKLIDQFDIRSSQNGETIVRSMSGGNQQKAVIAREISLGGSLIVVVQPTRGLDIGAAVAIHEHLLNLRDAGMAVLLVSLELDEVMALSDTIAVIFNGKIQTIQKADNFTANQIGEYMMGVHHEK